MYESFLILNHFFLNHYSRVSGTVTVRKTSASSQNATGLKHPLHGRGCGSRNIRKSGHRNLQPWRPRGRTASATSWGAKDHVPETNNSPCFGNWCVRGASALLPCWTCSPAKSPRRQRRRLATPTTEASAWTASRFRWPTTRPTGSWSSSGNLPGGIASETRGRQKGHHDVHEDAGNTIASSIADAVP